MGKDEQEILIEFVDQAEAEAKEGADRARDAALAALAHKLNGIRAASRLLLPVNTLDILAKGGFIASHEFRVERESSYPWAISASFGDTSVGSTHQAKVGKYRLTVILERLEE